MLLIKVWCLPRMKEKQLNELHEHIVAAVVGIKELDLRDGGDMVCLFPSDMMLYGLGDEIIVEVTGLFNKQPPEVIQAKLAKTLGKTVQKMFPQARVDCFVYPFDPKQGWWSTSLVV